PARLVSLVRALHLDHARAEVGEQARAVRAREHAGEVQHGDAVEERRAHATRLAASRYAGTARAANARPIGTSPSSYQPSAWSRLMVPSSRSFHTTGTFSTAAQPSDAISAWSGKFASMSAAVRPM